ncbi:MAG: ABC transporter substrate-binding protein [Puniceicoccales bacterium]|jgi:NitT/TauT family transport system substrate-binding protein|nr:ABC transporter substrate-binding protein [Puniceicoccales bacterium]
MKVKNFTHLVIQIFVLSCFYTPCLFGNPGNAPVGSTSVNSNLSQPITLHIGFFPNITHAQALIAQNFQREGKGWFEQYLPNNVQLVWHRFNAGPSAMESLYTHSLDITYVGPVPALNLYLRSKGEEVRILSGAVKGGSGLVIQPDLKIKTAADWIGKRIASPQYGNTQDIACRTWFMQQDIRVGFSEKDAIVLPTANPDQLTLFKKKEIAGVWTVEPWLSRLIREGQGELYYLDQNNWTTILVASKRFCTDRPEIRMAFAQAHQALTRWIIEHAEEAAIRLQAELKHQTTLEFPKDLILASFQRLTFTDEITKDSFHIWVQWAKNSEVFKNLSIQWGNTLDPLFQFTNAISPSN